MSKKLGKIIVPLCMLLGIFGLWYMQQQSTPEPIAANVPQDGPFALHAKNIDLPELKSLQVPMIIDFGADACVPCKAMAPVLVKLNAELQNKAIIKFVDVWKNPQASKGFPVQVIPTQLIFNADGSPYVPNEVDDIEFIAFKDKETQKHIYTVHQGGLTEEQMRDILEDMEKK